jgi:hypothetical protein
MSPLDIIYTPLITNNPPPTGQYEKICEWVEIQRAEIIKSGKRAWHVSFARMDGKWLGDFEQQFPELVDYCLKVYDLKTDQLASVMLGVIQPTHFGPGYWHRDLDHPGLRFYLEIDDTVNTLQVKLTKEPYDVMPDSVVPTNGKAPWLQDEVYAAKMIKPRQGFFLNSIRAIHQTNINIPNPRRITVTIGVKDINMKRLYKPLNDLIMQSTEEYSDCVIRWTPQGSKINAQFLTTDGRDLGLGGK